MPLADDELTISQAAREFHLNRYTVLRYARDGYIPSRKELSDLGTEYYVIKREDLANFLQNIPPGLRRPKRTP